MSTQPEEWVINIDNVFETFGFTPAEQDALRPKARLFVEAVADVLVARDVIDEGSRAASSTAPLFIPGKAYHINVSKALKDAVADAFRTVEIAVILHNLRIVDLTTTITVRGIVGLALQLTHLAADQRRVIEKILRLKKESGLATDGQQRTKSQRVLGETRSGLNHCSNL